MPSYTDRCIAVFTALGRYAEGAAELLRDGHAEATPCDRTVYLYHEALQASEQNPWFTKHEIARAFESIAAMLDRHALEQWVDSYPELQETGRPPAVIYVIMAGNIPLVGFHDLLCIIMSGHRALCKLSSNDTVLPLAMANLIGEMDEGLGTTIRFTGKDTKAQADAVIATGSDNTARYFEYYFGNLPHIIRKNRNGAAILTGKETSGELQRLGRDVFSYYGLGCRNVSLLLVPRSYDIASLNTPWERYTEVLNNAKYLHNYTYQKAMLKVSNIPFVDGKICLFVENPAPASPISVVHFTRYNEIREGIYYLAEIARSLQCVAARSVCRINGLETIPLGTTQQPGLFDYADGIDTMEFLLTLHDRQAASFAKRQ